MDNFQKKLETLINQTNQEKGSDTPDFILAEFLRAAKSIFDYAVNQRTAWYKRGEPKINEITDVRLQMPEGRLLMAALAILTSENWTDQTPGEALRRVGELATHMYDMTPEESRAQPLSWKPNEERDELKNGCNKPQRPPSWDELLVPGFEYTSRGIPGAFLHVAKRDYQCGMIDCSIVSMRDGSQFPVYSMSVAHEIAAFERGDNTPIPKSGPAHPFKPGCTFKLKNNFGYVFTINSVEGNIVKCTETLGFMDYANHDYKVDQLLQGLKTGELLEFKEPEEGQAQHERGGLKTEVYKGWD